MTLPHYPDAKTIVDNAPRALYHYIILDLNTTEET